MDWSVVVRSLWSAAGAGHVRLEAAVRAGARDLADRLDRGGALVGVLRGERDRRERDAAVPRIEPRRRRDADRREDAGDALDLPDLLGVGADLRLVGRCQSAGALVDRQREQRVAVGEALLERVRHLVRLRVRWQRVGRRGLVGRDLRERHPRRRQRGEQRHPYRDHHPLAAAAGHDVREHADHRRAVSPSASPES